MIMVLRGTFACLQRPHLFAASGTSGYQLPQVQEDLAPKEGFKTLKQHAANMGQEASRLLTLGDVLVER